MAGPLNTAPFEVNSVVGTFTFTASAPLAVIALRGLTNEAGEWVATALPVGPVLSLPSPFSATPTDPVLFPHFAAGGGWSTEVILVNPTSVRIAGTLEFRGPDATPAGGDAGRRANGVELPLRHCGRQRPALHPRQPLRRDGLRLGAGHAREQHRVALRPAGVLLRRGRQDRLGSRRAGHAGLDRLPGPDRRRRHARVSPVRSAPAWRSPTPPPRKSGVSLEITRPDGSLVPPLGSLTLPPGGQTARMLDRIISLPEDFSSGLLRVSDGDGAVSVVALRIRINARGELKASALWPQNETAPATFRDRFFAHLADTGGWTTELILYSGTAGETASGTLSLFWSPAE